MKALLRLSLYFLIIASLFACDRHGNPNNPYPKHHKAHNAFYAGFTSRPKTLDPARSYVVTEAQFTGQIYEPPLQYHYLKRPYQLIPLTAAFMPQVTYYDEDGKPLADDVPDDQVAYSIYDIVIKPGINYQPHPALAKNKKNNYAYHQLTEHRLKQHKTLSDFSKTGTRELVASDYVYQIKRLADPKVQSPIAGFMQKYIVGMRDFTEKLQVLYERNMQEYGDFSFVDLRDYSLQGAKVIDRYHYQVILNGKYPQFLYWLAMPFFAPMPWEADHFYLQKGMSEHNLSLDWYPLGTGPYLLAENNPNKQMVMTKNPNFHGEKYPDEGELDDEPAGLLDDAGKQMPFVDSFIFKLERENIPMWNKFLQGYYDQAGIAADSFDQAIKIDRSGEPDLTKELKNKEITLRTHVDAGVYFLGFNMQDGVVGGVSERAKKLRQALAIAIDFDEYISIFLNGRGEQAHSPVPPGIFGSIPGEAGMNPVVYEWKDGRAQRKSLQLAKQLLADAGYAYGIDPQTGQSLVLNYDAYSGAGTDERAQFNWMRKQFAKLGIQLYVRSTHFNRFQEKLRTGNVQIYFGGWSADYPDPENFLFLLYGPNGKVNFGGENLSNFVSDEYDRLFETMKGLPNGTERKRVIAHMTKIIQQQVPWIPAYYPRSFQLFHSWNHLRKASNIINNGLKYAKIDAGLRAEKRAQWNRPIYWPLVIVLILFVLGLLPVIYRYWQRQRSAAKKI